MEAIRLPLGRRGNKCDNPSWISWFQLWSLFSVALFLYMAILQGYVFYLDFIISLIMTGFAAIEFLLAFLVFVVIQSNESKRA
mmetsp:Transcript_94533/g.204114  ORF Transcript_94533/g.204114 Transcript_94533/m.204114 type:complete len:83 (+) Transcript_94533:188-436(+)